MGSESRAARPLHINITPDLQNQANSFASKRASNKSGTADSAKPVAKRPKQDMGPAAASPSAAHPEAVVPRATLNEVPQHADRTD